jgi:hypothetical protein
MRASSPYVRAYGVALVVLCKLVLYEKARGAKYNSQSKVVELTNEAKYFATV